MKGKTKAPKEQSLAHHPSTESIRRSGTKNILISVFVAGTSYYSLTLIAKHFGGSQGSDIYFFIVSLSTLTAGIIGSLLGTVFLPAFINLLTNSDKAEADRFVSSIFSWCLLLSFVVSIPTIIWNEQFFMIVSKFDEFQISQMHQILRYFAPLFLLSVLTELFRVIALSIGKFSTAAITAFFPPFFLIIFLAYLGDKLHEEALVASLLFAKIAALIMLVIVVSRNGVRVRLDLTKNLHTFQFINSSVPYWSANVITNSATFYFDYQASGLGTGVLTAISYANRVFMLPVSVIIAPLVEIARTQFALYQSKGDREGLNNFYNKFLSLTFYITIPISSIILLTREELVSALFQQGKFLSSNVLQTSDILFIYTWTIPVMAMFLVNGRICESYQKLFWPSFFGTIGNLSLIFITFTLTEKLGYIGIPAAKLVIEYFYFLPFGFMMFIIFGGRPNFRMIFRTLIHSLLAIIPIIISYILLDIEGYSGDSVSILYYLTKSSLLFLSYVLLLMVISKDFRRIIDSLFKVNFLK